MRSAMWLLMFGGTLMAADTEQAFISLLSYDQLGKWSGDRAVWMLQRDEIHSYAARQPTALVYDGWSPKNAAGDHGYRPYWKNPERELISESRQHPAPMN